MSTDGIRDASTSRFAFYDAAFCSFHSHFLDFVIFFVCHFRWMCILRWNLWITFRIHFASISRNNKKQLVKGRHLEMKFFNIRTLQANNNIGGLMYGVDFNVRPHCYRNFCLIKSFNYDFRWNVWGLSGSTCWAFQWNFR